LCDRLDYLAYTPGLNVDMTDKKAAKKRELTASKHVDYLRVLGAWATSKHTTLLVSAVHDYIMSGTILKDLAEDGVIKLDKNGDYEPGKINGSDYGDCLVRWIVNGEKSWESHAQIAAWQNYYLEKKEEGPKGLCMITGEENVPLACAFEKGTLQTDFNCKIISVSRVGGFVFEGRVKKPEQIFTMGYLNSQKAYKALRWIASNQGVAFGFGKKDVAARTYLVWNPNGYTITLPFGNLMASTDPVFHTPTNYKSDVRDTMLGYRMKLPEGEDVFYVSFESSSKGRLSIVSYGRLTGSEYYDHIQNWYETLCWEHLLYGVSTPPMKKIVAYAYGIPERSDDGTAKIRLSEGDEKAQMSALANCLLNGSDLPASIVNAISNRASQLQLYTENDRENLLATACAVISKHLNDKKQEEEWTMALDQSKHDRSYQFGRLLAVFERAELNTYDVKEKRDPQALRLQSAFCARPMHTSHILMQGIQPYMERLGPERRKMYRDTIDQIMEKLDEFPEGELNRPLGNTYLLGFSLQRLAFKNDKTLYDQKRDKSVPKIEDDENEDEN
jgi:CRISPR-associated protein Csd1